MSDPVWPHRRQPIRLPHSWDSLGKNTGMGCHFLLQCMKVKSQSEVTQSCPTLSDPMDCSLPGSSIHGIFQARVLEWGAIAFSRNTWNNRQIWPWNMEWSRAKANRILPRECTGHSKHLFQQHRRRLYTWTSPDDQCQNQTDYILCSQRWRSSRQQNQHLGLTVVQTMSSLLQNSGFPAFFNPSKVEKVGHSLCLPPLIPLA